MRSVPLALASLAIAADSSVAAFMPAAFLSTGMRNAMLGRSDTSRSPLQMISSFDKKPSSIQDDRIVDPEKNIQAYLKKNDYGIISRDNLLGNAMVSGLVRSSERTDQTIFDMLNTEASGFNFDKIYAHVDDSKFAKKRLLSRSARYSGLLDRLDFAEAKGPGALPTTEEIVQYNISNWIAIVEEDHLNKLQEIYDVAYGSKGTLQNVGILLTNAFDLDMDKSKEIIDKFAAMAAGYMEPIEKRLISLPVEYHIVAVGRLEDYPEGSAAYAFEPMGTEDGTLPEDLEFSRELAMRLVTDMLQCDAGSCKALAFAEIYDPEETEAKLIKGLREGGFNHAEEIEHMLKDGPKNYKDAIADFKKSPYYRGAGYGGPNWWEAPEYADKDVEKTAAETARKEKEAAATAKSTEIETIAKEWAKREFFRESMAGTTELKEDKYVQAVWDRALMEGELKYREIHGEKINAEIEYADFDEKQKRKEETLLKRAKEELTQILEEEGLNDESYDDPADKKD